MAKCAMTHANSQLDVDLLLIEAHYVQNDQPSDGDCGRERD